MLTKEIKTSITESVLCWLATVDETGTPNCSPKEVFCAHGDDTLLIANIASPQSVLNIRHSSDVCVSFVHIFKQKGYKLNGLAQYHEHNLSDSNYTKLHKSIYPLTGDAFPVQGIIQVKITKAQPIIAPGYYMVKGVTEESQIKNAKKLYGV